MSSSKSWFRLPFVYRARAERRESPALAAFHWEGSTLHQHHVANISCSGAYVYTQQRWKPGELVSLTLQRAGALETSGQRRFTVQAKTIRRDREGVGVTFLLPRGAEMRLWHNPLKADVPQTEPEDVVREFRTAAAIALINRIAPEACRQGTVLLREGLSNFRLDSAIEIALHAEEILALEPAGTKLCADPSVVLRILDDGSWAETEWIQHFWSGLLATSCVASEARRPDLRFPTLLSQLTTIQARIFAASCVRAMKYVDGNDQIAAHPLVFSAEEMTQIAGTHDLVHVERDVLHLMELGLVDRHVKWKFFSLIDNADITPTKLALEFYARCQAFRGDAAEFYTSMASTAASFAAD